MSLAPDENHRINDLLTFGQVSARYGGSYWQWRYALNHGKVQGIRLTENGPHLLVRSSVETFVKMRSNKKKRIVSDTPPTKSKSSKTTRGTEVL